MKVIYALAGLATAASAANLQVGESKNHFDSYLNKKLDYYSDKTKKHETFMKLRKSGSRYFLNVGSEAKTRMGALETEIEFAYKEKCSDVKPKRECLEGRDMNYKSLYIMPGGTLKLNFNGFDGYSLKVAGKAAATEKKKESHCTKAQMQGRKPTFCHYEPFLYKKLDFYKTRESYKEITPIRKTGVMIHKKGDIYYVWKGNDKAMRFEYKSYCNGYGSECLRAYKWENDWEIYLSGDALRLVYQGSDDNGYRAKANSGKHSF